MALLAVACAWGVLEVHSSTDTWIGLAGGRQIWDTWMAGQPFPTHDTFSFTASGQVWLNQNWLTHLWQYWMYHSMGPDAVIYGTWVMAASIFLLTGAAALLRTRSSLGAIFVAALVGYGGRDFLSARPATTGFFCIAAQWFLLCALQGQDERRRWWPIVLLLPLMVLWSDAHGSFVFGFGLLGLYLGHWYVVRLRAHRLAWLLTLVLPVFAIGAASATRFPHDEATSRPAVTWAATVLAAWLAYATYWLYVRWAQPRLVLSDVQGCGLLIVLVLSVVASVALSPFGLANLIHVEKVAASDVWRQVSEWTPPTIDINTKWPPMSRFWWLLGLFGAGLAIATLVGLMLGVYAEEARLRRRISGGQKGSASQLASDEPEQGRLGAGCLHLNMFDLTAVAIGLALTLFARRFAPMFYIYASPVALVWLMRLAQNLAPRARSIAAGLASLAAIPAAILLANRTSADYQKELVTPFRAWPDYGLLQRVTRYDTVPDEAVRYLADNALTPNILCGWTHAGAVMFGVPGARVFIDGRAQQVYEESHYRAFQILFNDPSPTARQRLAVADGAGLPLVDGAAPRADAVLLWRAGNGEVLRALFRDSGEWVPVGLSYRCALFFRKGSAPLEQAGQRLRADTEKRDSDAFSIATRGHVWAHTSPPNVAEALRCWLSALEVAPQVGITCYDDVVSVLLANGRKEEARRFVDAQRQALARWEGRLPRNTLQELRVLLERCAQRTR